MYLLDTNIVSYIQKGDKKLLEKIKKVGYSRVSLCSIVVAELFYGAKNHPTNTENLLKYYYNLSNKLICYTFDKNCGIVYGQIKKELNKIGKSVDDMDLLIASICLANDLVLVTNNVKHFENIIGLEIQNWTRDE
jgi:tRNA(fMet)-specific endonuclease VapC